MRQGVAQDARGFALRVIDVAQAGQLRHAAGVRVQPKVVLELAGELLLQHAARAVDEALQAVSCCLVEGHELLGSGVVAG